MQAWHCIAIITVSILLFIYGIFRNEIEDHVYEQEVDRAITNAKASGEDRNKIGENSTSPNKEKILDSPAWAKYEVILKCKDSKQAQLHLETIKGASFLKFFLNQIRSSTTASELIFSPFKSEFFSEDEYSILQSLFSAHTILEDDTVIHITCRGHTSKSTKLFATLILDSYKLARQQEEKSQPLASSLLIQYEELTLLEEQIIFLKEEISTENNDGSTINVEAIALSSEMMMLEQELAQYKKILLEIDKLFKADKPTDEYLKIESFSQFGMIDELKNTIHQLRSMLVNQELEDVVFIEVKKNIETNELLLKNEVANAIEDLKAKTIKGMERKKTLSFRLVDLRKSEGLKDGSHPKFNLLKELEEKLQSLSLQYQKSFTDWKQSSFDVVRSSFAE
ncbi:MAG: hypothetical protein P8N49_06650 [Opitutales bacterium]|nr:hypothetical protein [Opitutales bacterium]